MKKLIFSGLVLALFLGTVAFTTAKKEKPTKFAGPKLIIFGPSTVYTNSAFCWIASVTQNGVLINETWQITPTWGRTKTDYPNQNQTCAFIQSNANSNYNVRCIATICDSNGNNCSTQSVTKTVIVDDDIL